MLSEANDLIELTSFPTFVTAMGKGGVNEELPNFGGVYAGAGTHAGVKEAVETSDAVMWIGNYPVCLSIFNLKTSAHLFMLVGLQHWRIYVSRKARHNHRFSTVLG